MILKAIRVEGWRCFASPVELRGFSERINIVHAPNATGKSTLFEALTRALFDKHKVTGEDVRRFQPWGRSLSPTVVVEFDHGGQTYRLEKKFLSGHMARLHRLERGHFVPFRENDRADEFVREMLMGQAPGRGVSSRGHWGLGQILWAPQGNLAVGELSNSLVRAIHQVAGGQFMTAEGTPVEERIERAYLDTFQRKKGAPKKDSRLEVLTTKVKETEERVEQWSTTLEEFEELSRRVENLASARQAAEREVHDLETKLADARERERQYATLRTEVEKRRGEENKRESKHALLHRRVEDIASARRKLSELREAQKRTQKERPKLTGELEQAMREHQKAEEKLHRLETQRRRLNGKRDQAEDARRLAEQRLLKDQIEARIQRIANLEAEKDKLQEERNNLVAPDRSTLRKIKKAAHDGDLIAAQLDAALITLEIVPERPATLKVVAGEESGTKKASKGKELRVRGSPLVAVEWKGVGRVAARGPGESARNLRPRLDKVQRRLAELTAPYPSDDISELEKLREKAAELDSQIERLKARLEEALGGETPDALREELAEVGATIQNILAKHPDWEQNPPDAENLLKKLSADEREFNDRAREATRALRRSVAAVGTAKSRLETHKTKLANAKNNVRSLEEKLAELTSDGLSDHDRMQERDKLARELNLARVAREDAEKKLNEFPTDPAEEVENLEKRLEATRRKSTRCTEEERNAAGRLEFLAAKSPYSAVAKEQERLESLRKELQRERLRAHAIKLLRETLRECKKRALDSIKHPLEQKAARLLHRIAGPRIGRVELDGETLGAKTIRPLALDMPVEIENLSGGEKEQLYLAVRLALAELFCREERQLVVLDDVLTATDSMRFARIQAILDEAADKAQLIILTCHPERYGGLEQAKYFDLERARQEATQTGA